mmetsp:Transcript_22160/g.49482  ORF Transcript_22160/g.49482 Transcript_22160/m.49482 type:complete len:95 (+) Transcript_22160:1068-1352(+)
MICTSRFSNVHAARRIHLGPLREEGGSTPTARAASRVTSWEVFPEEEEEELATANTGESVKHSNAAAAVSFSAGRRGLMVESRFILLYYSLVVE